MTENIIRPNIKLEQNTVILREVEESVTEALIQEMFESAACPPIVSCRSEANNNWFSLSLFMFFDDSVPRFVVFSSEVDARTALEKIKNSRLEGKVVRARLKTESLIRRFSKFLPARPPQSFCLLSELHRKIRIHRQHSALLLHLLISKTPITTPRLTQAKVLSTIPHILIFTLP